LQQQDLRSLVLLQRGYKEMKNKNPEEAKTKRIAFNVRVEPYWYNLKRLKSGLNFIKYLQEKWKASSLLNQINVNIKRMGVNPSNWDKVEGKCIANIRISKMGVLEPLKLYAKEENLQQELVHLVENPGREAIYIPLDFPKPFMVNTTFVGSSVALLRELAKLDESLQISESFSTKKLPDFLDLGETELTNYETKYDRMGDLWIRLGFVILKKLAILSVQNKMPIIFS
jgi:hypothetical protein